MKVLFKFIVPAIIIIVLLLALATDILAFWGALFLFLLPLGIIYIVTVNIKELRTRSRIDIGSQRNLLIIFSLVTTVLLIVSYLILSLHFPGATIIKVVLSLVLIASSLVAIFYFVRNFNAIDNYVVSEFYVILIPILFGLTMILNSNIVSPAAYNGLLDNMDQIKKNNEELVRIISPDSISTLDLKALADMQNSMILLSGGLYEAGHLVNPRESEIVGMILVIQGRRKDIEKIIRRYSLDNNQFTDLDKLSTATVAEGVIMIENLKTAILLSLLERRGA